MGLRNYAENFFPNYSSKYSMQEKNGKLQSEFKMYTFKKTLILFFLL